MTVECHRKDIQRDLISLGKSKDTSQKVKCQMRPKAEVRFGRLY